MNDPRGGKEQESAEYVPHTFRVEMVDAGKVCIDGLEHGVEKDKQKSATPPGHLHTKEAPGFFATLWSEPKGFVRQVDLVW